MNKQKCLILTNGECVLVTREDSKYYYADGRQFRRMSKQVISVEEAEIRCEKDTEEENAATQKPTQPKKKRKSADKKPTVEE